MVAKTSARIPRLGVAPSSWSATRSGWLSMGFSYDIEENMTLDFGYTHIWLKDGKVNQTGSFGEQVVGKSESKVDMFAVGGTLRF